MLDPVIILAPARSFTSVVCAMLGQHPQLYDLPEVSLFAAATMRQRRRLLQPLPRSRHHGLLRAVAQLYAGEQSVKTVKFARRWIRFRIDSPCVSVFRELAVKASPRLLVDKSHTTLRSEENLWRILRAFPDVRFLHLLRHPRTQGESLLKLLASSPNGRRPGRDLGRVSPQRRWLAAHTKILNFLAQLPEDQSFRVRGEDLLADPDTHLKRIAQWLGLRSDAEAVDAMRHPETSHFACLGPENARAGTDPKFMRSPALRTPTQARPISLEGPLSWARNGEGFLPDVKALAREFGYS